MSFYMQAEIAVLAIVVGLGVLMVVIRRMVDR